MVDINENSAARKMAEDLVWRLETLQHRCRYNFKTGEYRQLPTRIRRFSNAKPLDIVASVIEELVKMAPYSGVVFCGEDDADLKYRPTTTYIKKDDTLKTGSRDATYTIVQDLLLDGEVDEYYGGDGSSCSSVSECEYHWDEADVMDCPQGGQGISYRIAGVSRDRETDLFSYEVHKVQAITQHQPEFVTECSDESVKTMETWNNVYGEPGDYRYDDVVHKGEAISIPAPCDAETGDLVQVSSSENDDCTYRVSVVRVTSKLEAGAMFLRYRDQYQIRAVDLQKNVHSALSKSGVEYSNGRKTTYESESNPDGTYNNRVTVETERPVSKHVNGESVSARYKEVSWVDRNQSSAAKAIPSGYTYGMWRSTKTPGGLYDNEFTGIKPVAGVFGYECTDTAFLHTHSNSKVLDKYPSESHASSASNGVVTSYAVTKDDRGIVVERKDVRTEHPFSRFRVSVTSTLLGQTTEIHDRSQRSAPSSPGVGSVGATEYQVTDGRLYDVVKRTFARSPAGLKLGLGCSKTVFEHSDSTEQTADAIGSCVTDAGGGVRYETRYDVDPSTGSIRSHEASVRELPYPSAQVSVQGTSKMTLLRYTDRNASSAPASALRGVSVMAGHSEQRETNPGGSTDVTVTQVTPRTGVVVSESCELDVTQHTHDSETVLAASVLPGEGMSAGGGMLVQTVVSTDDNGVATKRSRTVTEFDHVYGSRVHEDAMQAHQIIEETSGASNPGDVTGSGHGFSATEGGSDTGSASKIGKPSSQMGGHQSTGFVGGKVVKLKAEEYATESKVVTGGTFERGLQYVADSELTRGGRFHSRKHTYVAKPQKWLDAVYSKDNGGQYTWHFRNLTHAQCQVILNNVASAAGDKEYENFACHPFMRRSMNDFGLYDGEIGFDARSVQYYGGKRTKSGDPDSESATDLFNWWEKTVHISPITQMDPNASDFKSGDPTGFLVETVWSHYRTGYGVTQSSLNSFLKETNGAFWASPRINFDNESKRYTYTVMDKQKTTIKIVAGKSLSDSVSDVTLIENNDTINELDNPPS